MKKGDGEGRRRAEAEEKVQALSQRDKKGQASS